MRFLTLVLALAVGPLPVSLPAWEVGPEGAGSAPGMARGPSLAEARHDIDAHFGQRVHWGGVIVDLDNRAQGAWLEVREHPLDAGGRPLADRPSGGRFLVRVAAPLDPAAYRPGRPLGVKGVLRAEVAGTLGGSPVRLAVVRGRSLQLWSERKVRTLRTRLSPDEHAPRRADSPYPYRRSHPGYRRGHHGHGYGGRGYDHGGYGRGYRRGYHGYALLVPLAILGAHFADGYGFHYGFAAGHGHVHRSFGLSLHFHD